MPEPAPDTATQPAPMNPNVDTNVGIVIVDHGSRRAASNQMLETFVGRFSEARGFPIVEAAHMELAEPSIATAFDQCVQRGATKVLICPYFLLPGKHWDQDIPELAAEAAGKHPGVEYVVTAPIGLHPMMADVIESRLDHCLQQMKGQAAECEACAGTGRCQFQQAG
ncbi:MAG: CbiX/SirB N-terminal domain-containing protein [Planctomycetota bacterium]